MIPMAYVFNLGILLFEQQTIFSPTSLHLLHLLELTARNSAEKE